MFIIVIISRGSFIGFYFVVLISRVRNLDLS